MFVAVGDRVLILEPSHIVDAVDPGRQHLRVELAARLRVASQESFDGVLDELRGPRLRLRAQFVRQFFFPDPQPAQQRAGVILDAQMLDVGKRRSFQI